MTDGSQTTLGQLLDSISRGFQQTPLEIFLFFFIVFALLTTFVVIFFAQKRKSNLGIVRRSRVKIGLTDTRPTGLPVSSSELAEGSAVLLVAATGARFRGTIIAQGPFVTSVKLSAGGSFPGKGVRISLYFHNSAGIYSYPSRIVDLVKDVVHLEQTSTITFHQPRRKYFRRKEHLPVFLRPADSLEAPKESILLDVGGGGASLQNPPELLKKGEMLELSFSPETEKDHDPYLCALQTARESYRTETEKSRCDCLTAAHVPMDYFLDPCGCCSACLGGRPSYRPQAASNAAIASSKDRLLVGRLGVPDLFLQITVCGLGSAEVLLKLSFLFKVLVAFDLADDFTRSAVRCFDSAFGLIFVHCVLLFRRVQNKTAAFRPLAHITTREREERASFARQFRVSWNLIGIKIFNATRLPFFIAGKKRARCTAPRAALSSAPKPEETATRQAVTAPLASMSVSTFTSPSSPSSRAEDG
jgi:hypothetical protein